MVNLNHKNCIPLKSTKKKKKKAPDFSTVLPKSSGPLLRF